MLLLVMAAALTTHAHIFRGSLASASYHAQMQRFLKSPPDPGDTTQLGGGGGGLSLSLDSDLIDVYGHGATIMRWEIVRLGDCGMGQTIMWDCHEFITLTTTLSLSFFYSSPPIIGLEKGQQKTINRTPSNVSMAGFVTGMESGGWGKDGTIDSAMTGHQPSSSTPPHPLAIPLTIGSGSPYRKNDDQVGIIIYIYVTVSHGWRMWWSVIKWIEKLVAAIMPPPHLSWAWARRRSGLLTD